MAAVVVKEGTPWGDILSGDVIPGDTAWMIVSTALVFLMTPALGTHLILSSQYMY